MATGDYSVLGQARPISDGSLITDCPFYEPREQMLSI